MKGLELIKSTQGLSLSLKEKIDTMLPSSSPVDHFANLSNLVGAEIKSLKSQELKLTSDRKSLEALLEMADKMVLEEMKNEGLVELGGSLVKYVAKLNPHKLVIEDESLIPEEYKKPVTTIEIRKDAIKDELKMGGQIPGCKLTQDISLQLKANT